MKVIDMHCDSITKFYRNNTNLRDNKDGNISLLRMKEADYAMQCFAMFAYLPNAQHPFDKCKEFMDHFDFEMRRNKDIISQVFTYEDLEKNIKENKMSALLTVEEGGTIEGSLENLEYFYNRGVRMMTLTWNFENEIGYPNNNMVTGKKYNNEDGLKPFGLECIKKMNELGMIIDVSHGSDKLFWDCINNSTKPIVASHSDARAVHDHPRNLTDEMLIALAKNGGITGINYCPNFIGDNTNEDQMKDIVAHIKHIVEVGGIDVCALGSDFDGIPTPIGMSDCSKLPLLAEELEKAGFTQDEIEKIFYKNFLRVFKENCK